MTAEIIHQRYLELFYPTETQWREKAAEDFTAAAKGILDAKLQQSQKDKADRTRDPLYCVFGQNNGLSD